MDSRKSAVWFVASVTAAMMVAVTTWGIINVWLSTAAVATLSWGAAWMWFRESFRGWARGGVAHFSAGALGGVLMAAVTHLAFRVVKAWMPSVRADVADLYRYLGDTPGPIGAFPVLIAAVLAEEVVWRGAAFDAVARHYRDGRFASVRVVGLTSILYAIPQTASGSPWLMVVALVCGAVWSSLRARTGSLAFCSGTHLMWDALIFGWWTLPV